MPLVDMLNIIKNTFTQLEQIPGKKEKQKKKYYNFHKKTKDTNF